MKEDSNNRSSNSYWENINSGYNERKGTTAGDEYSQRSNNSSSSNPEGDNWHFISSSRNNARERQSNTDRSYYGERPYSTNRSYNTDRSYNTERSYSTDRPYNTERSYNGERSKNAQGSGAAEQSDSIDNRRPSQNRKKNAKNEQKRPERSKANDGTVKSKNDLRREHSAEARRKRRRKIFSAVAIITLAVLAIAVVASLTIGFDIEEIKVEGESRYSVEKIIAKSGVSTGDNLWRTSSKKVSNNLTKSLPYIGSVKLKREIPSRLILIIEDTSPKFALTHAGKYILVDENDKILETGAKKAGNTIIISGIELEDPEAGEKVAEKQPVPETEAENGTENENETEPQTEPETAAEDKNKSYKAAKQVLNEAQLNGLDLTEINVADLNLIWAIYEKNIRLDLGSLSQIDTKMQMANEIITKLKGEDALNEGVINLKSASKAFYKEQLLTEAPSSEPDKKTDTEEPANEEKTSGSTEAASSENTPESVPAEDAANTENVPESIAPQQSEIGNG